MIIDAFLPLTTDADKHAEVLSAQLGRPFTKGAMIAQLVRFEFADYRTPTVTSNGLRVRTGPGMNYEVTSTLKRDEPVDDMERVTDGLGTEWVKHSGGWSSARYLV